MATRILLVEDDPRIRRALVLALTDEQYDVIEASTGESAIAAMESGARPDVVLLDLMLPGIDGTEVCRRIRSSSDLPIIMVTALDDSADVIAGLEAGADDYVRKPVDASELTARIRALLRRARGGVPGPNTLAHLELDDLRVYPGRSEAFLDGTLVRVTKTEFRLLCELLWAGGRPVSREELLQRVWGYGYFGDTRLLDVHIRRLRLKVETDPSQPKLIITVRGVGYRAGYAPAA